MEEAEYNITNKEFKQISKWAENVYNIAVIVDYFVSNQPASDRQKPYNEGTLLKIIKLTISFKLIVLLQPPNKFSSEVKKYNL